MAGLMVILTAPSGTGKTTLAQRVLATEPDLAFSVSHTTRPGREGEEDGVAYHFVDDGTFDRMVSEAAFAEWAHVHQRRYGTSHQEIQRLWGVGRDILFDIDPQGGVQLMKAYPEAVSVFLVPPSMEELERRLRGRSSDSEEQINTRLGVVREEIAYAQQYGYTIVNDDLETAVDDFRAVIRAERQRTRQQRTLLEGLLGEQPNNREV